MRSTARIGSSLAIAFLLGAQGQEGQSREEIQKRLRTLAAARDEQSREDALKFFDELPLGRMVFLEIVASAEDQAVYEATQRWLPHPAWNGVVRGTIGDARRKERELLGPDPKRAPGEFRLAIQRVALKGDASARKLALRLFRTVRAPDPERLVPLLKADDPDIATAAAWALVLSDVPALVPEVLRLIKTLPAEAARPLWFILGMAGTPDLIPQLVAGLHSETAPRIEVLRALQMVGDARAELALIDQLERLQKNELFALIQALSFLGGDKSISALRKHREGLPASEKAHDWCREALLRLRDPAAAREILAGVRAGRQELALSARALARLGDRGILEDLLELVREAKLKVNDHKAAIELIGVLGGKEQVELLIQHLKDGRYAGAAATALGEIGDARAVRPLAEALRGASLGQGTVIARALLMLPLEDSEEVILEVLSDPKGHQSVIWDAIRVAGRLGGDKIKAKLMDILTSEGAFIANQPAGWAIIPLLRPEDLPRLREGTSPAKPYGRTGCVIALAGMGDPAGLEAFVQAAAGDRISDMRNGPRNTLALLSPKPPGLAKAVEAHLLKNPRWFSGAEFLAWRGNDAGRELLKRVLKEGPARDQAAAALMRLGDGSVAESWIGRISSLGADAEEALARALDEAALRLLRDQVWSRTNYGGRVQGRLLARRGDRASAPLFQYRIRAGSEDNDVSDQVDDFVMALALARMGRLEARPDFLRWLRSRSAARRALGARCLALLGDRTAIHDLAPILDDLEAERQSWEWERRFERIALVRDVAADAMEALGGQKFAGTPRERAQAAKAWYARERDRIR